MAGIAVGVAMLSWTLAYFNGFIGELVKSATSVSLGQVQIASQAYIDAPAINNTFALSKPEIESIRALPGVVEISPRIKVYGLVGNEDRSAVAQIIGVDPERDALTTSVSQAVKTGHWLTTPKPVEQKENPEKRALPSAVIGHHLARQIGVKVGDELVLFFEAADGALGNELLEVSGILKSGNTGIDRTGVFMNIETLQEIAALEDRYHIAPIKIKDVSKADLIAERISTILKQPNLTPGPLGQPPTIRNARPWGEIIPQIKQLVEVSDGANYIYLIFVYFIIAFGLFNAARMSALERKREFAMMLAIGVPRSKLFWTVLLETIVISVLGAIVGTLLGSLIAWYHQAYGFDMSAFSDSESEGFSYMGVSFSSIVYFVVTPSSVLVPFLAIVPVGVICGLWPAVQSARTVILKSLSNRN